MKKLALALLLLLCLSGCAEKAQQDMSAYVPAESERLTIFTSQASSVYEPLVREFEARTGIWVTVEEGSHKALTEKIAGGDSGCDVLFGGSPEMFEAGGALFSAYDSPEKKAVQPELLPSDQPWLPFSKSPVVLIYNIKLVRITPPQNWSSLLDPDWKGKIAFADPVTDGSYDTFGALLQAIPEAPEKVAAAFAGNLEGQLLEDSEAVVSAVAEGRSYIGVTLEENAQKGIEDGLDLAIVYPGEGTRNLVDCVAIVKDCPHAGNAEAFVDFLLGRDVQSVLTQQLCRRPIRADLPGEEQKLLGSEPVAQAAQLWENAWKETLP